MLLDRFFDAMEPFLEGASGVQTVVARLGPSPSGPERLALYAELVRRQRRDVLDGLFPAVRAACDAVRAGLWGDLVREYVRVHPPRHWEPNHFGEAMSDFLSERRAGDPSLPAYLEELADYEFVRFIAGVRDVSASDGVGLENGLFVRRYDFDVVEYVDRVVRSTSGGTPPAAPACEPATLVIGWSYTERRVLTLRVSLAALAAIAGRALRSAPAVESIAITAADEHLVRIGLLGNQGRARRAPS
jgi:hypothetical protein